MADDPLFRLTTFDNFDDACAYLRSRGYNVERDDNREKKDRKVFPMAKYADIQPPEGDESLSDKKNGEQKTAEALDGLKKPDEP